MSFIVQELAHIKEPTDAAVWAAAVDDYFQECNPGSGVVPIPEELLKEMPRRGDVVTCLGELGLGIEVSPKNFRFLVRDLNY